MQSVNLAHEFALSLEKDSKTASTSMGTIGLTDQMVSMLSFLIENTPGADIFVMFATLDSKKPASPTTNHAIIRHMDTLLRTIGVEIQQWESFLTLRLHHPVVVGEIISPGDGMLTNATMQGTAIAYDDYHVLSVNGVVGVGGTFVEAAADWQLNAKQEGAISA